MSLIVIISCVFGLTLLAAVVGYLVGVDDYDNRLAWTRARIAELEHRERRSRE